MSTTTPKKTQGTALLAHTQQATAVVTLGAAIDVSGKFGAQIHVKLGRTIGSALTNEVLFRLEASAKSSANDEWYPIYTWTSASGKTTANSTTVSDAAFNAGDTTFVIASATGITAGDILYVRETGTPANSEWVRVASMSGTTVTVEEAVTRSHTNGIAVTDYGEMFSFEVPNITSIGRIRLVVDSASSASGQTVDVIAWMTTLDSLTTA